jgi:hypothetical protein
MTLATPGAHLEQVRRSHLAGMPGNSALMKGAITFYRIDRPDPDHLAA